MTNYTKDLKKKEWGEKHQDNGIFFSPQFQNMLQFQVKKLHMYLACYLKSFC